MAREDRMNIKAGMLHVQATHTWVTKACHGLSEIKFVKSWQDAKILYDKLAYLLSRTVGLYEKVDGIPPGIQIEPTNFCNASCICCPASRSSRKRGVMKFELFQKIIDDAAQSKMKIVHMYLHGEPMLHPKIIEMIRYVKVRGLAVHLTTNGMLFNREKIIAILNSGINCADHFVFSVLGGSKEVCEEIMKKVDHDRVLENIRDFLALRKEYHVNGPVIETMFYVMPENQHEVKLYLRKYQCLVDHAEIACRISSSISNYKIAKDDQTILPRTRTCSHLWERLHVFWNGDVTVCSHDFDGDRILGNLTEQSIHQICANTQLFNIKTAHKQKLFMKLPFCYGCDF